MLKDKDLHKMTTEELGRLFPIIIQDSNKNWTKIFEKEKELLVDIFDRTGIESIEHIGSTAIQDLKAKPIIDILMEVHEDMDSDLIKTKLNSINYQYIQRLDNPPPHMMFVKGYSISGYIGQAFHIHVRYKGDWDELYFRDYLRRHDIEKRDYERLKMGLAICFRNDREAYTIAKSGFVENINKLARKEKEKEKNTTA